MAFARTLALPTPPGPPRDPLICCAAGNPPTGHPLHSALPVRRPCPPRLPSSLAPPPASPARRIAASLAPPPAFARSSGTSPWPLHCAARSRAVRSPRRHSRLRRQLRKRRLAARMALHCPIQQHPSRSLLPRPRQEGPFRLSRQLGRLAHPGPGLILQSDGHGLQFRSHLHSLRSLPPHPGSASRPSPALRTAHRPGRGWQKRALTPAYRQAGPARPPTVVAAGGRGPSRSCRVASQRSRSAPLHPPPARA